MEFFNTFGGNPVSCSIGTEVLRFVKREKLQENSKFIGDYFKKELKKLSKHYLKIDEFLFFMLFLVNMIG